MSEPVSDLTSKPIHQSPAPPAPTPQFQPQSGGQQRSKLPLIIGLVVALIVIAAVYWYLQNRAKPTPQAKRVVKVGVIVPLTEDGITIGEDRKRAINLARKDLNLQEVDIQLFYRDSGCDAEVSVPALKDLIAKEHVVAVIGDECSDSTLAMVKEAEKAGVVIMSPAATSPALTLASDYLFRTVPSDTQQGKFAAQVVYRHGYRKLAILREDGVYGAGLSNALTSAFKALGGQVVIDEPFKIGSVEFTAPMQHIKAADPDAIFIASGDNASDTAIMLKLKQVGLKVAPFGSEAMAAPVFIKDAGEAAEGLLVTRLTSGTDSYQEKYRAEYHEDAGDFTAQTYDAYTALALAIKSGANTGTTLKAALYSLSFDGASEHIKFDQNGDVTTGNYEVVAVKNRQIIPTD